jgi:glycosyltransferase involved in cell wall biosynthesis
MKFLLITNNDYDGVGQHVLRTNIYLNKINYKSKILVLHKTTNDKNVFAVKRLFFLRLFSFFLNFIKINFKDLFSFGNSTIDYKSIKKYVEDSDILIIFSLHKILSYEDLNKILSQNKIVYFRPLDLEFATGGCHTNFLEGNKVCQKYKNSCDNCPKLNFLDIFNTGKLNLLKKKLFFLHYKPRIFVENTYTQNIYNKSLIFKKNPVEKIFLGTKDSRKKFYTKKNARKILKIDKNQKIILFGTFNLDAHYKGSLILKELLYLLDKDLDNINLNNVQLVTFGNKNNFHLNLKNIKWQHLGLINSDHLLNLLYRAADMLLCPSIIDNGPHIVTEALLNDLPIVAFNQGVAQDVILNGINGYLIPCYDKFAFVKAIHNIIFYKKINITNIKNKNLKFNFTNLFEINQITKYAQCDLKNKIITDKKIVAHEST